MENNMDKKTAFIAIVGRPNAGKSTLLNSLLGEKISIVSKKPQTTRNKITGVLTKGDSQYVFLDTPGIHQGKSPLGKYMLKSVKSAMSGVDALILMAEPIPSIGRIERGILEKAARDNIPLILVVNKIDTVKKEVILQVIAAYSEEFKPDAIIPISALKSDGTDILISQLEKYLQPVGFYFPDDMLTDQPERQIAAETVREKTLRLLDDEIPHGIAVIVEEWREKENGAIYIRADIICERESHKGIIIGKNGEMIKKIGTYAKEDLEDFFQTRVFLDLWIKVKNKWRDNPFYVSDFGYGDKEL